MSWWKIGAIGIGVIGVIWVIGYVMTPPPGKQMPDQGREHVGETQIASFAYNSNPPTSGPHLSIWVKPGVYTEVQKEGELIHSLEHGYVVLHYNCAANVKVQMSNVKSEEATGSAVVDTPECKTLMKHLEDVVREKKLKKLILVPRPNLDAPIALTAWTYIDKLNDFDAKRIGRFIDYHRDHGPEQTME